MGDVAKTIDQLEATVAAVTYAANTNTETQRDIEELFVTLRSQLEIHSGLPTDSPLRSGDEPETQAAVVADAEPARAKATAKK